jgi:hypothetical protein
MSARHHENGGSGEDGREKKWAEAVVFHSLNPLLVFEGWVESAL